MTTTNLESLDRAEIEAQHHALTLKRDQRKAQFDELGRELARFVRPSDRRNEVERERNLVGHDIVDLDKQLAQLAPAMRRFFLEGLRPSADDVERRQAMDELFAARAEAVETLREGVAKLSAARQRLLSLGGDVPARFPNVGNDFAASLVDCWLEPPSAARTAKALSAVMSAS